jgi:tRNA(Ile)-lysidine synthase
VHKFVRNLITEWRRLGLPFSGETVVVAVSGGADSVSLLLALDDLRTRRKLDLRIIVAHFDHRLREASQADLEFVRGLTVARHFELATGEWKHTAGGNLEQNARNARYGFLLETAEKLKARFVLTGHTMNDQAETVLMNLIRGSGITGLGGMRTMRDLGMKVGVSDGLPASDDPFLPFPGLGVSLVRPLLSWSKRFDVEAYCRELEIDFRPDPMNEDLTFKRVWVRKVLLPMIEEMNPKIVDTLCRTAELLQLTSEPPASGGGFDAMEERRKGEEEKDESGLNVSDLKLLSKTELYAELRSWLREKRGNLRGLQLKHIEAIESLIHSRKSGRVAELPGGAAVKHAGRLEWRQIRVEK